MIPQEALRQLGGIGLRGEVEAASSRAWVDHALAEGDIVSLARGRLALPDAPLDLRLAHQLSGTLSHLSAARRHGWSVLRPPDRPHVIVRRSRRLTAQQRGLAHVHYADLKPSQVCGIVTDEETTLRDCLRLLPPRDALAVADSALRSGVPPATMARVAATARGPGSAQLRRLARAARATAANPFESALRAISLDVAGLRLEPQVVISTPRVTARPDLVDVDAGIVAEADSFEWHGDRRALRKDARRYNLLSTEGWTVLRFTWEDVMTDVDHVAEMLAAALAQRRAERPRTRAPSAHPLTR